MSKDLGTLVVVVLKARNLPDNHSFYKQDVFAQVTFNGATKKTRTELKGGQHPEWDEELRFQIPVDTNDKTRTLQVSCWSKEPREDDCVGKGTLDISETLQTGEFDDWIPLNIDGVVRGDLYLEMTFFSSGPKPAPLTRRPSKLKPSERLSRPTQPVKSGPHRTASGGTVSNYSTNGGLLAPPSTGFQPARTSPAPQEYQPHHRLSSSPERVGSAAPAPAPGALPAILRPGAGKPLPSQPASQASSVAAERPTPSHFPSLPPESQSPPQNYQYPLSSEYDGRPRHSSVTSASPPRKDSLPPTAPAWLRPGPPGGVPPTTRPQHSSYTSPEPGVSSLPSVGFPAGPPESNPITPPHSPGHSYPHHHSPPSHHNSINSAYTPSQVSSPYPDRVTSPYLPVSAPHIPAQTPSPYPPSHTPVSYPQSHTPSPYPQGHTPVPYPQTHTPSPYPPTHSSIYPPSHSTTPRPHSHSISQPAVPALPTHPQPTPGFVQQGYLPSPPSDYPNLRPNAFTTEPGFAFPVPGGPAPPPSGPPAGYYGPPPQRPYPYNYPTPPRDPDLDYDDYYRNKDRYKKPLPLPDQPDWGSAPTPTPSQPQPYVAPAPTTMPTQPLSVSKERKASGTEGESTYIRMVKQEEEDIRRRREQEELDMEFARKLDLELNM